MRFPSRYYRAGQEMVRMASIHCEDQDYETAFVQYMKYLYLFTDRLPRDHPEFNSFSPQLKAINESKQKEVMRIAEKVKMIIWQKYSTEYGQYVKEFHKEQGLEDTSFQFDDDLDISGPNADPSGLTGLPPALDTRVDPIDLQPPTTHCLLALDFNFVPDTVNLPETRTRKEPNINELLGIDDTDKAIFYARK